MKKIVSVLAVVVVSTAILACGGSVSKEDQNTAGTNEKTYRIAFIVKSLQSAFFLSMMEAAEKCDADFDEISVDILAPQTPFNIDEQIQLVEQCITNKVDAIVIAPCDSVGIIPAIEKANAAGIPVVTPNTKSAGGKILSFVGVENYDVGYDLGVALCEKLGGRGNVLLMEGKAGNSTSEERTHGFKDAVKKYSGIKLLDSQPTDWDRAKSMTVMENWLQTYDRIDGVLTLTKDMGLGALEAIRAAGRTKDIVSITFDIDDDVITAFKSGDLYGSGNQNEKSQAYCAITSALFALKGYVVDSNQILPITVVTAENYK
jgi:ABC-type sugar transport system substrate-binding protein